MFVVSTHLVRVLLAVSQRGALLQYAPEVRPVGRVVLITHRCSCRLHVNCQSVVYAKSDSLMTSCKFGMQLFSA